MDAQPPGLTLNPKLKEARGLPLNTETMFSNHKGVHKKGIEKRQTKLAGKLTAISSFLEEGERVLLITTACSPTSLWEQLTIGWLFVYLKRSFLVFTDRRILHVPAALDFTYRNSIAQILYADCEWLKPKGRKLVVKYKSGKKETFHYLAKQDPKKIKSLLPTVSFAGEPSRTHKRTHLCPRCTVELEAGVYTCGNCQLEFKSKKEARRLSIRYPGGGYFYTGHPVLGVSDAITEIWLLVLTVLSLIDMINGVPGGGIGVAVFGVGLVIEKLMTISHSNHFVTEYIPVDKVVDQAR